MNKILIIAPDYYPAKGGVENFLFNLNKYLDKKYDIEIFSGTRVSPKISKKYIINNVTINKHKTFKFFGIDFPISIFTYFELFKAIKKNDIVFINDVKMLFFSIIFFTKLLNKKTILVTHGLIFHNNRYILFKNFFIKIYLYIFKNFITKIVSNGMTDNKFLLKNMVNSNLINNGISLDKFKCNRNIIKERFVFFGRLSLNKGIENLINFLSIYKKKSPNFKLVIMGSGDFLYTKYLKKKINNMNLSENIELIGEFSHEELMKELSISEFVFNPSKFESFGFTLIEALAAGCTVIASNIEQYQLIDNGSNSFYLVDFNNNKLLFDTINKARANYQNANIQAIVLAKNFSIDTMSQKYLKLLNEISKQ